MHNLGTVMRYPATWVALVVLVAVEVALLRLFDPGPVLTLVLVGLGVMCAAAWPLVMLATGTTDQLRVRLSAFHTLDKAAFEQLEADLRKLKDNRGQLQLEELKQKQQNLVAILGKRFNVGEMTLSRYLAGAQEVYNTTLQNLREVAISLQSVSTIDATALEQRLAQLSPDDSEGAVERANLEHRIALLGSQRRRADELLALNEMALTALDTTATAMAEAAGSGSSTASEAAIKELEELATRAARYRTTDGFAK